MYSSTIIHDQLISTWWCIHTPTNWVIIDLWHEMDYWIFGTKLLYIVQCWLFIYKILWCNVQKNMMTSSNGNIFCYWPFVRGIHRSPVNSLHKGQWRGALMFALICAWINGCEAGDLRCHRTRYDIIVMFCWNLMVCITGLLSSSTSKMSQLNGAKWHNMPSDIFVNIG